LPIDSFASRMDDSPITIALAARGKNLRKLPKTISATTTSDLYAQISKVTGLSPNRIRLTINDASPAKEGEKPKSKPIPSNPDKSLRALDVSSETIIQVKDLGPQIAWRTVFVVEYLGPMLIHPLMLFILRPIVYNDPREPSLGQYIACGMMVAHFAKREFETLLVHRFSNATMPAFNIFKNSAHYWLLSGLLIAATIYSPSAPVAKVTEWDPVTIGSVALFSIFELLNLQTHITLANLRPKGTTTRGVPTGWAFDLVTCPNYLFEILAWIAYGVETKSWAVGVFVAVAVAQMGVWAQKKERRYRKEFGRKRKFVMIPGLF
jgi:very-long-chain enoyl-CoA reductase